jgi:NAD+ diphosphatase
LMPLDILHLGHWGGVPCYVWILPPDLQLSESAPLVVAGLRSRLGVVDDEEFWLAGRAQQLAHWREYHGFCGRCGAPTKLELHERVLACTSCAALYYPRIAPCVIGIVMRGNQCLLAHNGRFAEGLYSALAGFVEAGESAEQALIREIREETGIEACDLEYVGSQPWPFPSQLMLGFVAHYKAGEIAVDGVEITHAQWFTADNLPEVPPPHTISGKLIQLFVQRTQNRD